PRPRIVGLTHIAVRVHDLNASRHFYGDLLGYPEIFTVDRNHKAVTKGGLPQSEVGAAFFKVNDRQYIVLVPESKADEVRFVDYALETDDAEAMRLYMKSMGLEVPDPPVTKNPTYNLSFRVSDPDDNPFEVMQYTPESLAILAV